MKRDKVQPLASDSMDASQTRAHRKQRSRAPAALHWQGSLPWVAGRVLKGESGLQYKLKVSTWGLAGETVKGYGQLNVSNFVWLFRCESHTLRDGIALGEAAYAAELIHSVGKEPPVFTCLCIIAHWEKEQHHVNLLSEWRNEKIVIFSHFSVYEIFYNECIFWSE
jgi:hypothetical protein